MRAVGRAGWGSHFRKSDRSPLCGTSLPPRRQRASCHKDLRSPAALLPPAPLAPFRSCADLVPEEGSPLSMKQSIRMASVSLGGGVRRHLFLYNSANRPTHQFCFVRLIFQSWSCTFSTPNFPLTKKRSYKRPCALRGAHNFPQNTPFF